MPLVSDAHILDGMKSADFSQRAKGFDEASPLLASGTLAPTPKFQAGHTPCVPLAFCRSSNRSAWEAVAMGKQKIKPN
jgi:hypothetical protein